MKTVRQSTSLLHAWALVFAFVLSARASGVAALGDVSCGVYHNTATTGIPVSTNNYLRMYWGPEYVSLPDIPWWNWLGLIDTNAAPAPDAAVVSGQLKWAARCARQILDGACASAGGAGSEINAMISSFASWPNDEAVTTVDLLDVVRPIAIRVRDLYVDTMVQSIPPYPNPQYYPDAPQSLVPLHYLKFAFCFDPLYDWDEDGLPDWWERYWFSLGWHDTTPVHPDDDSDYDGLSNLEELYAATSPVDRDTDGDGLIDGVDPRPEYTNWWFDANGNGLSDDFERHWFGGLNASLTPDTPLGDGFTLGMKMAAGLCPTSPVPETVYPADGLSALLLVPRFGVSTNAGIAVWTRTFDLDGEEAWEHYFVSSSPNPVSNGGDDDCGAWALDGFSLEWEVSGEMPASASASPASSPLRIPIAPANGPPGGPRQLTLRLRTTRSGVTACPTPLYLLSYTPALEFPDLPSGVSGDALVSAAAAGDDIAFSVDWSAQPGPVDPPADGSDETFFERFGTSSVSFTRNPGTGLIEGGVLYGVPAGFFEIPFVAPPPAPPLRSILPLPPPARRTALAVLSPRLTFGTGHGPDAAGLVWDGTSYARSSDYPIDDESLWRAFHCDATGRFVCGCTPVLDLGIPDEYVPLFLTNVVVATDDGRETATATVHMDGELLWTGTTDHLRQSFQSVEANDDSCGCETCETDGPSSGSVRFRLSLGRPRAGQISGFVWFRSEGPVSVTPQLFGLLARPDAQVSDSTAGGIRTVVCSDVRGRTVAIAPVENGVSVAVTKTATGEPDHSWTIVNENGNPARIRFVRTSRAGNVQSDETYVCAGDAWSVADNVAGTTETVLRDDALNFSDWPTGAVERVLADTAGNELVHTVSLSRRFGSGPAAVLRETERREAVGTPFEKTFLATWWEDGGARAGLPRLLSGDARAWSWTDWDAKGRPILVFDQRDGAPCPDDGTGWTLDVRPSVRAFATVHSYDRVSPDDSMDPEDDATPRTTSRYVVDGSSKTLISRTWTEIVRGTTAGRPSVSVRTERAASQAAAFGAPGNAVSVSVSVDPDAANVPLLLRGRPLSYTDEDGVTTSYDYAFGSWDPATHAFAEGGVASHIRIRVFTTTPEAPAGIPLVSTVSETVEDATHGNEVWSATRVLLADGSLSEPFDWESRGYDDQDRLRSTLYADGTSSTNAYSCCLLLFTVGRDGQERKRLSAPGTDHLHHAWLDVSFASLPKNQSNGYLVPQTYDYSKPGDFKAVESLFDPLGRETVRRTMATRSNLSTSIGSLRPAPASAAAQYWWDISETNFYPFGTSDYRVRVDARGLRTETAVFRDEEAVETWTEESDGTNRLSLSFSRSVRGGSSETVRAWDDGCTTNRTFSLYGADGRRTDFSVAEASDAPSVTNSVSVSDFLGRTTRVVTPLSDSTYAYAGASSRALSVSDAVSGLATATLYDTLREPIGSLGSDGVASFSSTRYECDASNVWWRVAETREAAGGSTNLLSTVRERLTGLSDALRSEVVSIPAGGPVSVSTVSFDSVTSVSTETNLVAGLAPFVRRSMFGRTIETRDRDGTVRQNFFDPYGRVYLTRDVQPDGTLGWRKWLGRNEFGDVEVDYEITGRSSRLNGLAPSCASSLQNPGSTIWGGVAGFRTYDIRGNLVASTDEAGGTTWFLRDSIGRLVQTYGATYPSDRALDTAGRLVALGTTRAGDVWDVTQWGYDPATGLCTNKAYADGTAVSRAFTADGLPSRTTLASGRWTQNAYDADRRLSATTDSDGNSVQYAYDAFGRLASATNAAGHAEAFARNALGIVTNETQTVYDELFWTNRTAVLDRPLDAVGRPAGLSLKIDGDFAQSICYDYGVDGHLSGMVLTNAQGRSVSVGYDWNQGRFAGYTVSDAVGAPLFARTQTRASRRPALVTAVTNAGVQPLTSNLSALTFSYAYDAVGRPVIRNEDAFSYNIRGEVVSATIGTNAATYAYDYIGNRTSAGESTDTTFYAANEVNQYTNLTSNLPPFTSHLSYDADGNLVAFGNSTNAWNAAGRLVSTTLTTTNGLKRLRSEYDRRGRRVRRVLETSADAGATWTAHESRAFVYDDWNLLYERSERPSEGAAELAFFWGPDLSGSLQGAGGVGGLVAVSINGFFYFPGYDNNGNVIGYWDEAGALVAEYAYDAFGNTISSSGSMASTFPHRFSTKYYDAETDLYYYGYRYYSPNLGRWISRDPTEENGGSNLSCFCRNSGTVFVDAFGLSISHTITPLENDGWHLTINIPIQVIDCSNGKPRLSDQDIQKEINRTWTAWFEPKVFMETRPGVSESVVSPKRLTTKAVVKTVANKTDNGKDHVFFFNGKQSIRTDKIRDVSNAEPGGRRAWIYVEDQNNKNVFAHEFGHWLGLDDLYDKNLMKTRC